MGLYRRGNYWWFKFKLEGMPIIYGSTETDNKKLAQKIYIQKRVEVLEGKHFPHTIKTRLKAMIDLYFNDYARNAKESWKHDEGRAKRILEFFGDCYLHELTQHRIEQYISDRQNTVSKVTVNRDRAFLSHLFTKAGEWRRFSGENPLKRVKKFREESKPPRYLTPQERTIIFDHCEDFLKPILLLAVKTGMRPKEYLALKWENVDLERGLISVCKTKSKRMREIPIHEELLSLLCKIDRRGENVFSDANGKKYSKDGVFRGAWERTVKAAKMPSVTLYHFRDTFATELLLKGVDLRTVSEYLGHSNPTITATRYYASVPHYKRTSIQLLGRENIEKRDTGVTIHSQVPVAVL
jgi:integrase